MKCITHILKPKLPTLKTMRKEDVCLQGRDLFNASSCVIDQFAHFMSKKLLPEEFKQKFTDITSDDVVILTRHLFSSKKNGYDDFLIFKLVALSLKEADHQQLEKLAYLTRILTEKIFDILNKETYINQNLSLQELRSNVLMLKQVEYIVFKSSELGNGIDNKEENIAEKVSDEINFLVDQLTNYIIRRTYQTSQKDNYLPVIEPDKFVDDSKNSIYFEMNTRVDIFQNQIVGLYKKYLLLVLDYHAKCRGELKSSDSHAFEKFLAINRVRQIRGVADLLPGMPLFKIIRPDSLNIFNRKKSAYNNVSTTEMYLNNISFKIENPAQVEEIYRSFLVQKKYFELQLFIKRLNGISIYARPAIREYITGYVFEYNGFYGTILTHLLRIKYDQYEYGISNKCVLFAKSLQCKSTTYKQIKRFDHNQLRLWICNYKLSNKLVFISDMESMLLATSHNRKLTEVQKLEVSSYLQRQITSHQQDKQFVRLREPRNLSLNHILFAGYFPNLHKYQDTKTFTSIEKILDIFKLRVQRNVINSDESVLSLTQKKISNFISRNEISQAINYIKSIDRYSAYFALTEDYNGRILIDKLFIKAQKIGNEQFDELNNYWSTIVCKIITDEINLDLAGSFNNNDPINWSMRDFSIYVGRIKPYGTLDCLKHFYRIMAVIYMDKEQSRQKDKLEYFNDIINRLNNRNKASNWQELRKVARVDRAYITAAFKAVLSMVFFASGLAISATGVGLPIVIACGLLMSIMNNVLSSMISAWTEHINTKEYLRAKNFSDAFLKTIWPIKDISACHHNGTFPLIKHMTTVINMLSLREDKKYYIDKYFNNTNQIGKYFSETDASYLQSISEVYNSFNMAYNDVLKKAILQKIEQILVEMQQGAVDKYLMTQAIFRLTRIIWQSELSEQLKLDSFRLLRLLFGSDLVSLKQLLKTYRNYVFQNYYFVTHSTSGMLSKISNFGLFGHDLIYQPIIMLSSFIASQLAYISIVPFIDFLKKEPYAIRQSTDFLDMFIEFFEEKHFCSKDIPAALNGDNYSTAGFETDTGSSVDSFVLI